MSIESAKAFMERMKTDEDFEKKVIACKDAAERMAVAKVEGYDFSVAEAREVNVECTDKELEDVAGGTSENTWSCMLRFKGGQWYY